MSIKLPKFDIVTGFFEEGTCDSELTVSLVTHCSLDRRSQLLEQLQAWQSAASVALYLPDASDTLKSEARALIIKAFEANGSHPLRVSLLLGTSNGSKWHDPQYTEATGKHGHEYPINALRNLAADQALSKVVLLIDVDFVPSSDLRPALSQAAAAAAATASDSEIDCIDRTCIVIPTWEESESGRLDKLPRDVTALLPLVRGGLVQPFQSKIFAKGHAPTDFCRWLSASEPYTVDYADKFEPFVAMRWGPGTPRFDERFRGYGNNKIQFFRHVAHEGFRFVVWPKHFFIARGHAKSQAWLDMYGGSNSHGSDKLRAMKKKLYTDFVQELKSRRSQSSASTDADQTVPAAPTDGCCYETDSTNHPVQETRLTHRSDTIAGGPITA